MIGYTFEAGDRVFLLVYGRETRVFDLGPAARDLGHERADSDAEAWGRLILEKRQGGEAALLGAPS